MAGSAFEAARVRFEIIRITIELFEVARLRFEIARVTIEVGW